MLRLFKTAAPVYLRLQLSGIESRLVGMKMRFHILVAITISVVVMAVAGSHITRAQAPASGVQGDTPRFTQDGKLEFPANYREWIYLTSGLNMSYAPRVAGMAGHDMFDNVFVNRPAYKAFLETGTWPDQTMLVLEVRGAGSQASINKSGHFQDGDLMGRDTPQGQARPGRLGILWFRRDETNHSVSARDGLLQLSRAAWRGGYDVCAVLSHTATDRATAGHAERRVQEGSGEEVAFFARRNSRTCLSPAVSSLNASR